MKKKLWHLVTQYLYPILLLAAVVGLAVAITVAAYTNQGYKKGVATTTAVDIPFSSDLLLQVNQADAATTYQDTYKEFPADPNKAAKTFPVNIYNWVPGTPGKISTNDITYALTVTVNAPTGYTPASGYQLDGTAFTATATATGASVTLPRHTATTHTHNITIPYQDIGQVTLTVTAKPDVASSNALGNKMLARLLRTRISTGTTDTANVWSGRLADQTDTNSPTGFDAFNYEVSGIGKGTVTLSWPNAKLAIDPYFLADTTNVTFTDADASNGSIAFSVDAAAWNYRSIQFYRKAAPGESETWAAWQTAGTGIVFSFSPPA